MPAPDYATEQETSAFTWTQTKWRMCILYGGALKLEDKFTYLGSSISSSERDVNMHLAKVWTAINHMEV